MKKKCLTTLYQPCLQNIPLKAVVFSNKKKHKKNLCLAFSCSLCGSICLFLEISKGKRETRPTQMATSWRQFPPRCSSLLFKDSWCEWSPQKSGLFWRGQIWEKVPSHHFWKEAQCHNTIYHHYIPHIVVERHHSTLFHIIADSLFSLTMLQWIEIIFCWGGKKKKKFMSVYCYAWWKCS